MGFESSVRAGEIYVFCASFALTEELKKEFKAVACVEILDPRLFINLWQTVLPANGKHFAKKVNYYRREDVPGNVWPQPELIATTKLAQFAYQWEYRFGFSTTGALDFGQCTQQLVDRRARPLPKPDEHHDARSRRSPRHLQAARVLADIPSQGKDCLHGRAVGKARIYRCNIP
jgi:hypothetical protein